MKLNQKSWHAMYYKWASLKMMPDNLCSYFWKLLMLIILFPLLLIFALPEILIVSISYIIIKIKKDEFIYFIDEWESRWGINFLIYFLIAMIYGYINALINHFNETIAITVIVIVTISIFAVINYFRKKSKKSEIKTAKVKKPSLISEYWKAFKGKYCPRIDWY